MSLAIRNLLINIINVILLIITLFLALRIVFRLLGANPSTPFVAWVYDVSSYLITPFNGIFGSLEVAGAGLIDVPALISLAAYSLIGMVVLYLIRLLTAGLTSVDDTDHEHAGEHTQTHAHSH